MKRLLYLLMALSYTLFSCSNNENDIDNPDDPDNPSSVSLEISTTDLVFMSEKGEKEFTITCNSDWEIVNESQWCRTDVTKGNGDKTVTVTVDAYSETEDRNTNLTIKAGDKTEILTVTQKHGDAIILSKSKFDMTQEGGNITIQIESNIDYTITIPAEFRSWIQQVPESRAVETKNFCFTISANEDEDSREGYILFSGNSLKDTVHIYQAQKDRLVLTENTYTIPVEGQEITVELRTNVDYEVKIPNAAASWISQITTRAVRTDRLTFRIEANTENADRSAKIAIQDKNSNLSDTITIIQPIQQEDIIWETEQDLIDFKVAGHTRVKGNIIVRGEEIRTLQKLDNLLTEIDGSLTLECSSLTSLDGLYGLTKITGDFIVEAGKMIYFEGLENLGTIERNFKVLAKTGRLTSLTSFKGLNRLKNIGGDFEVNAWSSLTALESFEGLENLGTIGGNFKVIANYERSTPLTSFKGLDRLKSIGGDFEVNAYSSLGTLESFEGLENLEMIGGNLKVLGEDRSLTSLISFKGLNGLKSIGGDLEVKASAYSYGDDPYSYSLTALESFEGLENLRTIGGNFKVFAETKSLTSLISFKGLNGLKSISGDFEVNASASYYDDASSLEVLESFEGLENLGTIGGDFKILVKNGTLTSLTSFKGLNGLKSISGDFELSASASNYYLEYSSLEALESFEGLENLETIGGNFKVLAKDGALISLTSFKGLNGLKSISGNFEVNAYSDYSSLKALESFEGLENLGAIGGDFKVLAERADLPSLISFKGLNRLKSIGGDFEVNTSDCSSLEVFEGLENLGTIGGKKLTIKNCRVLTTIDALSKVGALDEITIEGCDKLYDFCVLKNVVQNMSGTFYVATCGYNPTKYQLLNGECSQTPPASDNN